MFGGHNTFGGSVSDMFDEVIRGQGRRSDRREERKLTRDSRSPEANKSQCEIMCEFWAGCGHVHRDLGLQPCTRYPNGPCCRDPIRTASAQPYVQYLSENRIQRNCDDCTALAEETERRRRAREQARRSLHRRSGSGGGSGHRGSSSRGSGSGYYGGGSSSHRRSGSGGGGHRRSGSGRGWGSGFENWDLRR